MTEEWVVYRLKRHPHTGELDCESRADWEAWKLNTKYEVAELIADGLTEEQAKQFVKLTEEMKDD